MHSSTHVRNISLWTSFCLFFYLYSSLQDTFQIAFSSLCMTATASSFSFCNQVLFNLRLGLLWTRVHTFYRLVVVVLLCFRYHIRSSFSWPAWNIYAKTWSESSSNVRFSPRHFWMNHKRSICEAQRWGASSVADSLLPRYFAGQVFYLFICLFIIYYYFLFLEYFAG